MTAACANLRQGVSFKEPNPTLSGLRRSGPQGAWEGRDEGRALPGGAKSSGAGGACCSRSCSRWRDSPAQHLRLRDSFLEESDGKFQQEPLEPSRVYFTAILSVVVKDRTGQDPPSVTEHSQVAKNHLIPTGNLLFPQVITLILVFFLFNSAFSPKKSHSG